MELETSKAKNTAPCQEMRQPAGRALGGTETFPGTATLQVNRAAWHPCLFPASSSWTVAGISAAGRGPGFATGAVV